MLKNEIYEKIFIPSLTRNKPKCEKSSNRHEATRIMNEKCDAVIIIHSWNIPKFRVILSRDTKYEEIVFFVRCVTINLVKKFRWGS